jgi:predicted metalloprotease with PDZ domain
MHAMHTRFVPIAITLAVLISQVHAQVRADLEIALEPDPTSGTTITLRFLGDADGETTLSVLPDWGGTFAQPDWFSHIKAAGEQGELEAQWDPKKFSISIAHEPGEPVTLTYTLNGNPAYTDVDDYAPLMTSEGVAFFTANTLMLPEHWFSAEQPDLSVSLEWQGLNTLQWIEYPTFGDGGDLLQPDRLREGMLVAGSFRSAAFDHGDARFHVVELGENASFTPATLAEHAKPMLSSVHDFVDDHAPSEYLITYAPAGEPVEHGFALGGTAVTNAFAFYFDPSVDLEANEGLAEVVSYVLCHEYVHNWNGIAFWVDEPEFEYQSRWFIEGFTDFITRRAMYEAGIRDNAWYTSEMHRVHDEYNANPHRDLTNLDAAPRWLAEPDISDMLYKRGELIALLIDQRVRKQSDDKHALRDLIRELVQESKTGKARVSPDRIFSWIEQHTDRDFRQEIERLVTQGGAIPFPESLDSAE